MFGYIEKKYSLGNIFSYLNMILIVLRNNNIPYGGIRICVRVLRGAKYMDFLMTQFDKNSIKNKLFEGIIYSS